MDERNKYTGLATYPLVGFVGLVATRASLGEPDGVLQELLLQRAALVHLLPADRFVYLKQTSGCSIRPAKWGN